MGKLGELSHRKSALDRKVKEISESLLAKARDQSWQYKMNVTEEAKKIGLSCGIVGKQHHPAHFIDIALCLLSYPPELAFSIAVQLSNFSDQLGYNPFGTVMVALGQIDSLYRGIFVRTKVFDENPELFEVISSKTERIQRAGKLLAVAILASQEDIAGARHLYYSNVFDLSVKEVLDRELERHSEDVAREILTRH